MKRQDFSIRTNAPACGAFLLAGFLLLILPAASRSLPTSSAKRFARGIVAVSRTQRSHDPRALTRLLGIELRNPGKWIDQPEGTYRDARWRNLRNAPGVISVEMNDVPVADGKEISSNADISLSGKPCIKIRDIEQSAGKKAFYGGLAIQIVYDAPSPPPLELGREHASIDIQGSSSGSTVIVMKADKPGPTGCLEYVSLQRTRPAHK